MPRALKKALHKRILKAFSKDDRSIIINIHFQGFKVLNPSLLRSVVQFK